MERVQTFPSRPSSGPLKCELPESHTWLPRPNPEMTGIRYMMSKHGCSIRNSWPLPPTSEKHLDTETGSSEGCRKVRRVYVGHRQRAGLWISVCMEHQMICGYHVIANGEGRRDCIIPLYRFMETPPQAIFGDYACGWEETALNYLPEFYLLVRWFHDVFHGCIHKCGERFESKIHAQFSSINTSLMEQVTSTFAILDFINSFFKIQCHLKQVNSFLQSFRGLLKSKNTKVSESTVFGFHIVSF